MAGELLSVENLIVSYGEIVALRDINLSVGEGEAVALIGANGAGKSSLLKTIIGLLQQKAGSITFDGRPLGGLRADQRARLRLGYCPEGREIFPAMSVRENLEVASWRPASGRASLVDAVYDIFPLLADKDDNPVLAAFRRPTADAGDRPCPDGRTAAPLARRTIAGPVAAARLAGVQEYPADRESGHRRSARRAERLEGTATLRSCLCPQDRPSGPLGTGERAPRERGRQGSLSRRVTPQPAPCTASSRYKARTAKCVLTMYGRGN